MNATLTLAVDRARFEPVAKARLRIAMRCLSAAAEAEPWLATTDEWRLAQSHIARLLGERAEIQGRKR